MSGETTILLWVLTVGWGLTLLGWVIYSRASNAVYFRDTRELREQARAERADWAKERQQLLDRIQAPSFDHLKHHEVKVIKAQQGEREPPKLDPL
jgi:hypothetical protein